MADDTSVSFQTLTRGATFVVGIEVLESRVVLSVNAIASFSAQMVNRFQGSSSELSVIADFSMDDHDTLDTADDDLLISLNNGGQAAHDRSDVVSCLFFDVGGTPALIPASATLPGGSSILNGEHILRHSRAGGNPVP